MTTFYSSALYRRTVAQVRTSRDDAAFPALPSPVRTAITLETLAPVDLPRDCVRTFPSLGQDSVFLAVYDGEGAVAIEMRLPKTWVSEPLERFLLRMVRHYTRHRGFLRRLK